MGIATRRDLLGINIGKPEGARPAAVRDASIVIFQNRVDVAMVFSIPGCRMDAIRRMTR